MNHYLDDLLNQTENVKLEIKSSPWDDDDVRTSFLSLFYDNLYAFYIGQVGYSISEEIRNGNIMFKEGILDLKPHYARLKEISGFDVLSASHYTFHNRNLFYGVWTSFEMCVSIIFDIMVNNEGMESIIKDLNRKLYNAIADIEEEKQQIIKDTIRKSAFIPVVRKFKFVVKSDFNKYNRDYKEDIEFLELASKLRNCMIHSNGLYKGNSKSYRFADTDFHFVDGEIFQMTGENGNCILEMASNMKDIFISLSNCTNDITDIPYPNDGEY